MHIILTHEQADFDAIASLLGAYLLNEDALPVLPRRMNRNVTAFLTLYGAELPFIDPRDLQVEKIDKVTLVDTQSLTSLKGMVPELQVHVIDHHPLREDLPGDWMITVTGTGANTTLLIESLRERDMVFSTLHATLLLIGIYEDTGSLTYDRTTARDLQAAAYLLEQGARLSIASGFLNHPLSLAQQEIYDQLRQNAESLHIHGYTIVIACGEAFGMIEELSTIVHKLQDLLDPDGLFVLVATDGGVQLIARSTTNNIDVAEIATSFGGGGHDKAAAGLIKGRSLDDVRQQLMESLPDFITPAITVAEIMSQGPQVLSPDTSTNEAAQLMRRYGYEGYPVVQDGKVIGLLTRRAVDRATGHKLNLPVSSLMNAGDHSVLPGDSIEYLQRLMIESGWGQIPVRHPQSGQIVGIVTRTDLLKTFSPHVPIPGRSNLAERLERALSAQMLTLLKAVAQVAYEQRSALYIVGGFVRDLLLNLPSLDFDLVVEGDGIALAKSLARRFGGRVTTHSRFGTAKWQLQGSRFANLVSQSITQEERQIPALQSLDLVTARTEFYTHPTALPTVERGSIKLDLHRRDFTINTLALRLDGRHYAELYDYWGGAADLRHKLVRVLHSLSFVDDPTRMLRAVRFEQRFNFAIENRTLELLTEALPLLGRVSGDRIRHELDHILTEPRAVEMLERLADLNLLNAIHESLVMDEWFSVHLRSLKETAPDAVWDLDSDRWAETTRRELAYTLWLLRLPLNEIAQINRRLKFPAQLQRLTIAAKKLFEGLPAMLGKPPSRVVAFLDEYPPLVLYAVYLASDDLAVKKLLLTYMREWRHVQPMVDGHALRQMGVRPGPIYKDILRDLRAAWLDGKVKSAEDESKILQAWLGLAAREQKRSRRSR